MSQAPYGQMPAGPPNWPAPEPTSSRGHSHLPIISSIGIALVAVAIAISSWFRPIPTPEAPPQKTYSAQEVADAKKAVCGAYEKANRAIQTTGKKDGDTNQTSALAVAVNVRLALSESGSLLQRTLATTPATSKDLADHVDEAAQIFQDISIAQLAEVPQRELDLLFRKIDATDSEIKLTCE